jgi:hypothetical protein
MVVEALPKLLWPSFVWNSLCVEGSFEPRIVCCVTETLL